jgi:hypothetical protein
VTRGLGGRRVSLVSHRCAFRMDIYKKCVYMVFIDSILSPKRQDFSQSLNLLQNEVIEMSAEGNNAEWPSVSIPQVDSSVMV